MILALITVITHLDTDDAWLAGMAEASEPELVRQLLQVTPLGPAVDMMGQYPVSRKSGFCRKPSGVVSRCRYRRRQRGQQVRALLLHPSGQVGQDR